MRPPPPSSTFTDSPPDHVGKDLAHGKEEDALLLRRLPVSLEVSLQHRVDPGLVPRPFGKEIRPNPEPRRNQTHGRTRSVPGRPSNHLISKKKNGAPSERIRTASEIPIVVALTDKDAVPTYVETTDKVLHLRRLGMTYASIAERLGINLWMAKRAARWAKTRLPKPRTDY